MIELVENRIMYKKKHSSLAWMRLLNGLSSEYRRSTIYSFINSYWKPHSKAKNRKLSSAKKYESPTHQFSKEIRFQSKELLFANIFVCFDWVFMYNCGKYIFSEYYVIYFLEKHRTRFFWKSIEPFMSSFTRIHSCFGTTPFLL